MRPSFAGTVPPENRGRRESRMPIAPAVVRTKAHEWTTGSTGSFRLSLREWVTAYFVLSPVTGLFLPPSPCGLTIHLKPGWAGCISARLDASIGAPGPHDFAVRARLAPKVLPGLVPPGEFWQRQLAASFVRAPADRSRETRPAIPLRARRCRVHRIPPRVRDDSRSAPHPGGTGRACRGDLPDGLSEIFLSDGLDRFFADLPVGQFSVVVCEAGKVLCRLAMLHLQFSRSRLLAPTRPTAPV